MSIKFKEEILQGTTRFPPTVSLAFDDVDAEPFFIAAGWADETDEDPVMRYPIGQVDVDPKTVFGHGPNIGHPVMPAAQEA